MMTDSQFKTMQRWFQKLNNKLIKLEGSIAHQVDKADIDKLHGLIERIHRRIDEHLDQDDKDKRLFKLAIERLDEKVEHLQAQI